MLPDCEDGHGGLRHTSEPLHLKPPERLALPVVGTLVKLMRVVAHRLRGESVPQVGGLDCKHRQSALPRELSTAVYVTSHLGPPEKPCGEVPLSCALDWPMRTRLLGLVVQSQACCVVKKCCLLRPREIASMPGKIRNKLDSQQGTD